MGLYLNPSNDAFWIASNDDIYIDKTELISFTNKKLNKTKRYVCVSRPRRFGKSTAAEMLIAYYSCGCDSNTLFEHFKIAKDETYLTHLNQHNVIYINIQQFITDTSRLDDFIHCIEIEIIKELREVYHELFTEGNLGLPNVLAQIYQKDTRENKGFIFIIDEWDCVFREAKDNQQIQKKYLDFLKSLFKDRTYVTFAYMTGILPIKKYGTHSAINIFDEYSMMNPRELAQYVGFTEDEVRGLCKQYKQDFSQVKSWYDGYHFEPDLSIYNPKSVIDVMTIGTFDSYWTETETYEALKRYIDMDFDGLKTAIVTLVCSIITFFMAVLHILLVMGVPIGEYVLGGENKIIPKKRRYINAILAIVFLLLALFYLGKTNMIFLNVPLILSRVIMVVYSLFLGYAIIGNIFFTKSKKEKYLMIPASIVGFICSFLTLLWSW